MGQMDSVDIAHRTMTHLLVMLPNDRTLLQIAGEKGTQLVPPGSEEFVTLDYASTAFECSALGLTVAPADFEARYIHFAAGCLNDVIQKASGGKPIIIGRPIIPRHLRKESYWVERVGGNLGLNIERSHNVAKSSYAFTLCMLFGVIQGYIPTFLELEQIRAYRRQLRQIAERVKLLKAAP